MATKPSGGTDLHPERWHGPRKWEPVSGQDAGKAHGAAAPAEDGDKPAILLRDGKRLEGRAGKSLAAAIADPAQLTADRPLEGARRGPFRGLTHPCGYGSHVSRFSPFRLLGQAHEAQDVFRGELQPNARPERIHTQPLEILVKVPEGGR